MLARIIVLVTDCGLVTGCATPPDRDGRYPGDASECDSLPLYERQACLERHPPLHDPIRPGR